MAPPKNLVTVLCILLAAPLSYAVYQLWSLFAAVVVLVLIGIVIPQVYARLAIPEMAA